MRLHSALFYVCFVSSSPYWLPSFTPFFVSLTLCVYILCYVLRLFYVLFPSLCFVSPIRLFCWVFPSGSGALSPHTCSPWMAVFCVCCFFEHEAYSGLLSNCVLTNVFYLLFFLFPYLYSDPTCLYTFPIYSLLAILLTACKVLC
jgi:hypothetical protein